MIRAERRIVIAAIAVFVALAGMAMVIHGVLYDTRNDTVYGGVLLVIGVAVLALMLTPRPSDKS
jgi:heme A synthase